jgi:D-psicose/D-tagatose/L-ribulose 3-epimerase
MTLRIGINLMAWTDQIGPGELALFPTLAHLGFRGVEIPVFDPGGIDVASIRSALRANDLACTLSTALPAGASLLRAPEQAAGIAFLRECIAVAARLGAAVLCGPLYAPVGQLTGAAPTPDEWGRAVAALRVVGQVAADAGVRLAIEPLNRFETYFLNTAADARRLVTEVGNPAIGILLDAFHLNIEEKDIPAAILQTGPLLYHVHCSENDRGVIGSGHIPWPAILHALRRIGYDGWLVCETFNGHLPVLAAATAIWRPLFADPLSYARDSVAYLKQLIGQGFD